MDRLRYTLIFILVLCFGGPSRSEAYSVLTHEAIIDAAWDTNIRPLLLARFPNATPEDLRKAHAYAYGGAIIQDMGYYPHGNKFFSDLTHYFRSGDFVQALLRDSQDIKDYAFAIGALAHYAADNNGHRLATNLVVPMLYPELRKKYGNVMTYEDDPMAHVKTEFGFDVIEVAKGRYAPDSYHDFIGFEVAAPLLERAFQETYGLDLKLVLKDEPRVINSYRHDVSSLIPKATKVAWTLKQDDIKRSLPGITRKKFLYNISRASYEKEWGRGYSKPGLWDAFLSFLYRILPKIGPLRVLTFRTPTPQAEKLFEESFNVTLDRYRDFLKELREGAVILPNDNIDVGQATALGVYRLDDDTNAQLLDELGQRDFIGASPELRAELLHFFSSPIIPVSDRLSRKARARLKDDLKRLETLAIAPEKKKENTQVSPH
ncbi:MAG: zinc dependent phospholipase C family protein [Candidatus Acidiferrum sp.]